MISTGLTCVSTNVAALVCVGVQNALVGLTVDEDDRSLRGLDGINDGLCGSGLHGVDDQHVHALLQEGVDLLGLGVLDSYAGKCCNVGADARQSGTYQGELILETETQGDINGDGKITYIMCKGDPENIDAQYRTEYSIKALTYAGKEVECLYEYLDNWDQTTAQQDVANALAQYGGKIEVVFCNNDAMTLGALQSIQQANRTVGKDIYLVGVDALVEAVQNVVDGNMTGTVLNDDVGQATKAAEATKLFVDGKDVEKYYWVDYVKVTKDNASQYLK